MANLSLVTADKINVGTSGPNDQHTFVAGGTSQAAAPFYINGTDGKAYPAADGTGTNSTGVWGLATKAVKAAGEPVTLIRRGILDGLDLSGMSYGGSVYLSTTSGRLADASPGTNGAIIKVGEVLPAYAVPLGTSPDKLLKVEVTD